MAAAVYSFIGPPERRNFTSLLLILPPLLDTTTHLPSHVCTRIPQRLHSAGFHHPWQIPFSPHTSAYDEAVGEGIYITRRWRVGVESEDVKYIEITRGSG